MFDGERDRRLIADGGEILRRPTSIGPVPNVTVELSVDAAQEIIVGQGPDRDLRLQASADYADALRSERSWIHVEPFRVPYRG